jgi:hypothetical protein
VSVCFSLYQSVSVCVRLFQFVSVCFSLCPSVSVCISLFQFVSVCFSLCPSVSVCVRLFQFVSVYIVIRLFQLVSVCFSLYPSGFSLYSSKRIEEQRKSLWVIGLCRCNIRPSCTHRKLAPLSHIHIYNPPQ